MLRRYEQCSKNAERAREGHVTHTSQHTSQALIHSLPPEILSRIFIILSQMFPHPPAQGYHYWPKPERMVGWSTVTEVSRRWREVALGCPKLWSRIAFHNVEWAKLMLERSKQAPRYIE